MPFNRDLDQREEQDTGWFLLELEGAARMLDRAGFWTMPEAPAEYPAPDWVKSALPAMRDAAENVECYQDLTRATQIGLLALKTLISLGLLIYLGQDSQENPVPPDRRTSEHLRLLGQAALFGKQPALAGKAAPRVLPRTQTAVEHRMRTGTSTADLPVNQI